MTASHMNRGNDHLIRRNLVHQQADCRDIRNGIHGSHLVEMDLRNRNAVGMALRLRNQAVNCHHILLHLLRNVQVTADDMLNIMETAVVMMRVTSITVFVGVFMGMLVGVLVVVLMEMIVMLMARAFMTVLVLMWMIVMLMMVMEHLLGFFLPMHPHGHMSSADAALAHGLFAELHTGNPQAVQFCHNRIWVWHQFQ